MSIVLEEISKYYGGLAVVDRVSLNVADGELFVLLGTSGSGKSTILRLIAGLAHPDGGRILLHGRDVTLLAPQQRGTGFVFQNYSIFRHMSVAENIEFGLRIRKTPAAARAQKRDELLELVGMGGLGARYPDQLSGGQQQRVALARALAYEPNVLLLDEPFGALDVKIRGQLRRSLREVQRKLKVTAILVTHDQEEAFELGDRIGVLDRGKLLEVGEPEELYARPKTLFAATFLGAGTVLVGRTEGGQARLGHLTVPIPPQVHHEDGAPVQVLFRPEQIALHKAEPADGCALLGKGTVVEQGFAGPLRKLRLRLPRPHATRQISAAVPFGEEGIFVDAVVPAVQAPGSGESWVSLRGWHVLRQSDPHLLIFDAGGASAGMREFARMIAARMNAAMTVLAVGEEGDEAGTGEDGLQAQRRENRLPDADYRVRVGDAAEQIAAEQNEKLYSMIVIEPEGGRLAERVTRGRIKASGPGPVVMRLLERSMIPILVVNRERAKADRILICTAVGEPGKNDVRVGGRLARRLGASVTLLHVTREAGDPPPFVQDHLQRAASTVRALEVPAEISVRHAGAPAQGILEASREGDYDVIVVGSHGPQSRSLFGRDDVTLQVLRGADRPVLVVPSRE